MRKFLFIAFCIFSVSMLNAQPSEQEMATKNDKVAYSLGVLMAQNLLGQGFEELDVNEIAKGLGDALNNKADVDVNQANAMLQQFMKEQASLKFQDNVEAGKKFLAENGKKEGVVTLPSGLQYEIITQGEGAKPKATDKVLTHYHGTLIDGTVFDSSVDRGEPISFPLNGVIAGWTEALQLMPVGSKYRLFIPPNLAYGDRNMGTIQPYSTLIFEVELLDIL